MGIGDREKAEDGASLSGQVQTNRWPVLPPLHPGQSGEHVAQRPQTVRERGSTNVKVEN